jgi:hypothetical protein
LPWADPREYRLRAAQERSRITEATMPEHEKAIAVRVPTGAPTFEAKLPQERWIGFLLLPAAFYAVYYSFILLSVLLTSQGVAMGVVAALAILVAWFFVAVAVKKVALRPMIKLDAKGLSIAGQRWMFFNKIIPLDKIQSFSSDVRRRKLDNAESWRLNVLLTDGSTHTIGAVKQNEAAAQIVTELEQTLLAIKATNTGYRVAV